MNNKLQGSVLTALVFVIFRLGNMIWEQGTSQNILCRPLVKPDTLRRTCEYDEDITEFWVNIRTEGLMSKEDLQQLSRKRTLEGTCELGDATNDMSVSMSWDFDGDCDVQPNGLQIEGEHRKPASSLHLAHRPSDQNRRLSGSVTERPA